MVSIKDYYTPPSDMIFNEIKREAIKIRKSYDNTYGYVDGKINRIEGLENVEDNAIYMVKMFDIRNQAKLLKNVSTDTRNFILPRVYEDEELYLYHLGIIDGFR